MSEREREREREREGGRTKEGGKIERRREVDLRVRDGRHACHSNPGAHDA